MNLPNLNLSTILGVSLGLLATLQHFFPDQPWIGQVAAAASAILLPEVQAPPSPPALPVPHA